MKNTEETIKAHLEKVFTEYIEYKNFLKEKVKPLEEIRKELMDELSEEQDPEVATQKLFEKQEKQTIYLQDLTNLLTRLYHTIQAYKDLVEIPDVITEEIKNFKFELFYSVKNNNAVEVNPERIVEIKNAIRQNIKPILKAFGY